jgi:hypothetical protein
MKINLNTNQVLELLINKITNEEPFLLTRIGDGEALTIENDETSKEMKHMYNRHLGYLPNKNIREEISNHIKETIINSDILSLRKNYDDPKFFFWKKVPELYQNLNINNTITNKFFCNHDIHFDFKDGIFIDTLLSNVKNLTLITSRDVTNQLYKKYTNLQHINVYKIPGEFMFEEEKNIKEYYPSIFNEISYDLKQKKLNGHLLLLGGGFVGKKLGLIFKERGGVSFDIGSLFDIWVGKITRGKNRGSHSYTNPIL